MAVLLVATPLRVPLVFRHAPSSPRCRISLQKRRTSNTAKYTPPKLAIASSRHSRWCALVIFLLPPCPLDELAGLAGHQMLFDARVVPPDVAKSSRVPNAHAYAAGNRFLLRHRQDILKACPRCQSP